jgi:hypothetical protein
MSETLLGESYYKLYGETFAKPIAEIIEICNKIYDSNIIEDDFQDVLGGIINAYRIRNSVTFKQREVLVKTILRNQSGLKNVKRPAYQEPCLPPLPPIEAYENEPIW